MDNRKLGEAAKALERAAEAAWLAQQPAAVDEATRHDAERYRWLRDNAGAWEA